MIVVPARGTRWHDAADQVLKIPGVVPGREKDVIDVSSSLFWHDGYQFMCSMF